MPQGKTKLVKQGSYVNVLVEPCQQFPTLPPDVTVYGPFPTADIATDERRILLSEKPELSGKILRHQARMFTLPTLVWGNSQTQREAG